MENLQPENTQVASTVNITILPTVDKKGAILIFNLFGLYEQKIFIPRDIVLNFIKAWRENERTDLSLLVPQKGIIRV